jgi:hypothetical protein
MIVTEEHVSAALAYLAADPHPLAWAEWEYAKAKIATAGRRAELMNNMPPKLAVARCEAMIECDNEYGDLQYIEAEAAFKVFNEKRRAIGADATIEIWRTENANARAAERVR